MKLLMLKGLPGSGKTTWAKTFVAQNTSWVRINKDSLREMMGSYRQGKDENTILRWRDILILESLVSDKKNVVVDDTNFHPKHEACLRRIADTVGAEFEVNFLDTPLDQCIKNDLKRLDSVGEKVIKKMWRQYLAPKYTTPTFMDGVVNAIICDIDGTLALHTYRTPYEFEKCETDSVNSVVRNILWASNATVILVTGREEKYSEQTCNWLSHNGIAYYKLFMRPTGDKRKDYIVKEEIYRNNILGKYNVRFVLDDRDQVVNMWRRNGLTCLQVADGDF